jgi:hypothetical protein
MRIGNQRPRLFQLPDGTTSSAADEAIALSASCGLILDDWQRWVLDGILSERVDGQWAAQQALLLMPRQNGKNSVLEALELAGLFLFEETRIVHTAQLAKTAADHMRRMIALIRANPELEAVCKFNISNGKEAIERRDTGALLEFMTRGQKVLRGGSPNRVVFDEALYLKDDQLAAMIPALSAQSLNEEGGPQLVYTSSAPLPDSEVLHRVLAQCLAGALPHAFFAMWGCEPGTDPQDRDAWYEANPGLGIRISEEWIANNELPILSPEAFAIERLGVVFTADNMLSELPEWPERLDPRSLMTGKPSIAVDCDPDLTWTSVAVAGERGDKRTHVELVDRFTTISDAVKALKAMHTEFKVPVHLDAKTATAALIPMLADVGVPIVEVSTVDLVQACAHLKGEVREDRVRHRQQPLDVAVRVAAVRTVGEGWAWTRRTSTVSISPLVAVTLATWAARNDRPRSDAWLAWE